MWKRRRRRSVRLTIMLVLCCCGKLSVPAWRLELYQRQRSIAQFDGNYGFRAGLNTD